MEAHLPVAEERGLDVAESLASVPHSPPKYGRMFEQAAALEQLEEAARERRLVKVPDVHRWAPWAQGWLGLAPA